MDGTFYADVPDETFIVRIDMEKLQQDGTIDMVRFHKSSALNELNGHLSCSPHKEWKDTFLVGSGSTGRKYIQRLDFSDDGNMKIKNLCRVGLLGEQAADAGCYGDSDVQVSLDGRDCFFKTFIDNTAYLASVDL